MGEISPEYLSKEEFESYCDCIIEGWTTRQAAFKIDKDRVNISKWLNRHATDDQRSQYARALEMSADFLVEDGLEIIDDKSQDEIENDNGITVKNREFIERSKERASYRKWMAGKRHSKKYGDALKLQGDKENPLELNHAITPSERAARLAEIFNAARTRRDGQVAGGSDEVGTASGGTDSGAEQPS